jgi:hypothetical protein
MSSSRITMSTKSNVGNGCGICIDYYIAEMGSRGLKIRAQKN